MMEINSANQLYGHNFTNNTCAVWYILVCSYKLGQTGFKLIGDLYALFCTCRINSKRKKDLCCK